MTWDTRRRPAALAALVLGCTGGAGSRGSPPERDDGVVRRSGAGLVWSCVVAALLVAAGAVVLAAAGDAEASFGWFAYQPYPSELSTSAAVIWTRTQVLGGALVVLGLLVAAAVAGYRLGRTRSRSR